MTSFVMWFSRQLFGDVFSYGFFSSSVSFHYEIYGSIVTHTIFLHMFYKYDKMHLLIIRYHVKSSIHNNKVSPEIFKTLKDLGLLLTPCYHSQHEQRTLHASTVGVDAFMLCIMIWVVKIQRIQSLSEPLKVILTIGLLSCMVTHNELGSCDPYSRVHWFKAGVDGGG